jgi:hypothetical protein
MGTTTGGLPYPEDTDQVMLGAQAMKALAQALDARPRYVARRNTTYTIGGGGSDVDQGGGSAAWEAIAANFTPGEALGFLAPITGFYVVSAQMNMVAPGASSNVYGIKVRNVNQANEVVHTQEVVYATGGATNQLTSVSGILAATLGDPIRLAAHQNSGATQNCAGSALLQTRLSAYYLGP